MLFTQAPGALTSVRLKGINSAWHNGAPETLLSESLFTRRKGVEFTYSGLPTQLP